MYANMHYAYMSIVGGGNNACTLHYIKNNDILLLDGTFYSNDELINRNVINVPHPYIKETLQRIQMEEGVYHIIVIPLLYSSPMKNDVDRIIVVNCTDTIQLQRLLKRDSETISQAKHIISSQASRQDLLKIADDLIQNNQSKQATKSQVIKLHQKYLEFFS